MDGETLQAGADVEAKDASGKTALQVAVCDVVCRCAVFLKSYPHTVSSCESNCYVLRVCCFGINVGVVVLPW
jgi:hypothetical protein